MNSKLPKNSKAASLLNSVFKTQQYAENLLQDNVRLGLSSYRILSVVDDHTASNQRHIATLLGQTEANVSRQLRHMADHGLVKIAPDKKDRRQRNITKTAKGKRKFADAEKILKKHEKSLLGLIR
jgi:DNA-binding MarR family transcriptional regulator